MRYCAASQQVFPTPKYGGVRIYSLTDVALCSRKQAIFIKGYLNPGVVFCMSTSTTRVYIY